MDSSIASAMGAFESSAASNVDVPQAIVDATSEALASGSASIATVSSMTDTMKRFEFGGTLLQNNDSAAVPAVGSLTPPGPQNLLSSGYLVASIK